MNMPLILDISKQKQSSIQELHLFDAVIELGQYLLFSASFSMESQAFSFLFCSFLTSA